MNERGIVSLPISHLACRCKGVFVRALLVVLLVFASACQATALRKAERSFYLAQEVLMYDDATTQESEQALAHLAEAIVMAGKIVDERPSSSTARQIVLESMFGIAELIPDMAEYLHGQAFFIAVQGRQLAEDEIFKSLFCYYAAKGFVGSGKRDLTRYRYVKECYIQTRAHEEFRVGYPSHYQHLVILMNLLIPQYQR